MLDETFDLADTQDEIFVQETDQEAQANLATVLNLCAAGKLRCSEKTRRPGAATLDTIAEALTCGDFYPDNDIAAFAWPLLLQAGGLATLSNGRLQLTARGRTALARPAASTIAQLWKRWLSHGLIDELSRIDLIKGQRTKNTLTAVKPRRTVVAEALRACPIGEWVRVDDLFTTMRHRQLNPTIARSLTGLWRLYFDDPQYGSLGHDGFHDWTVLEGRYTLCVLFEYAATLGLIDVTYVDPSGARDDFGNIWGTEGLGCLSRYDGLVSIRVNPLGAYVLGLADDYRPLQQCKDELDVKVLPNHEIVCTGTISTVDRLILDAFANRRSDRVWAVSAGTLLDALGSGRDLVELRHFLSARTGQDLPHTLEVLLTDVERRAGALADLGVAHMVECADAATALLIAKDRRASRLCRLLVTAT